MTISWRTLDWPVSTSGWLIWALLLIAIFVVLKEAVGAPTGVLGVIVAIAGFGVDRHFYIPAAVLLVGVVFLLTSQSRRIHLDLSSVARQAGYVGLGFGIYELGRKITEGDESLAMSNSARVLDFEQRLRLNFEPAWQQFVLRHDDLVSLSTRVYSSLYIPVVLGGLIWFLMASMPHFRILRNALALSAIFSLLTFWLYPVAPPRLLPAANVVDLHDFVGRRHGFVNEFAAVPSLHVGWTVLIGYMFFRTYRKTAWRYLAWVPGLLMLVTVIVTGNHYWFDGAVGVLYSIVPAAILFEWPAMRAWWTRWISPSPHHQPRPMVQSVLANKGALFTTVSLSFLLSWLIVSRYIDPGFTGYWGYMIAQIAGTILAVGWLTQQFEREGGLSWLTHTIIVVVTYADTLGTAAHFYDKYVVYDKITHFGGGLILAATAFEILLALNTRGAIRVSLPRRMLISVAVSVGLGAFWEFYELFGDAIFDTGRHSGGRDTTYDLISDTAGAIAAVLLLAVLEPYRSMGKVEEPERHSEGMSPGRLHEAP